MAVLLANIALAIPFLVVFIAVPLWLTVKRPETGADRTDAHRYQRARAAQAQTAQVQAALTLATQAKGHDTGPERRRAALVPAGTAPPR